MKTKTNLIVISIIAALHSLSLAGEVRGSFTNAAGKTLVRFVIPDIKTATTLELTAIFPKTCVPPLTYTTDGKFYCSKGTGPHELMLSSKKDRTILMQVLEEKHLIKEK